MSDNHALAAAEATTKIQHLAAEQLGRIFGSTDRAEVERIIAAALCTLTAERDDEIENLKGERDESQAEVRRLRSEKSNALEVIKSHNEARLAAEQERDELLRRHSDVHAMLVDMTEQRDEQAAQRTALRLNFNRLALVHGELTRRLEAVRAWTPTKIIRRAKLVELKHSLYGLSMRKDETAELAELQEIFSAYQDAICPLPPERAGRAVSELGEEGDT